MHGRERPKRTRQYTFGRGVEYCISTTQMGVEVTENLGARNLSFRFVEGRDEHYGGMATFLIVLVFYFWDSSGSSRHAGR
jgi:hypothetical protein